MLTVDLIFIAIFVVLVCGALLYQAIIIDKIRQRIKTLECKHEETDRETYELFELYKNMNEGLRNRRRSTK